MSFPERRVGRRVTFCVDHPLVCLTLLSAVFRREPRALTAYIYGGLAEHFWFQSPEPGFPKRLPEVLGMKCHPKLSFLLSQLATSNHHFEV